MPDNESKQNSWVMPYNPYLLAKYDAHINVEICANIKACKHIFKYVHKGSDRASLWIEKENGGVPDGVIPDPMDEIQEYQEARWVGSAEACWRIFAFKLHDHSPPIEWLSIHLPNQHTIQFDDNVDLSNVVDSAGVCKTTPDVLLWVKSNASGTSPGANTSGREVLKGAGVHVSGVGVLLQECSTSI